MIARPLLSKTNSIPAAITPECLKVPEADHETDIEEWFNDRRRSKRSEPEATVVGSFT